MLAYQNFEKKQGKKQGRSVYSATRRFRGRYTPARLHGVSYPLRTAKCPRSFYHSIPRRVAHSETHSARHSYAGKSLAAFTQSYAICVAATTRHTIGARKRCPSSKKLTLLGPGWRHSSAQPRTNPPSASLLVSNRTLAATIVRPSNCSLVYFARRIGFYLFTQNFIILIGTYYQINLLCLQYTKF